jgi:hypothetical protein
LSGDPDALDARLTQRAARVAKIDAGQQVARRDAGGAHIEIDLGYLHLRAVDDDARRDRLPAQQARPRLGERPRPDHDAACVVGQTDEAQLPRDHDLLGVRPGADLHLVPFPGDGHRLRDGPVGRRRAVRAVVVHQKHHGARARGGQGHDGQSGRERGNTAKRHERVLLVIALPRETVCRPACPGATPREHIMAGSPGGR